MGGGDVRSPPSARQSCGPRRRRRPAGARLHTRRTGPRPDRAAFRELWLGAEGRRRPRPHRAGQGTSGNHGTQCLAPGCGGDDDVRQGRVVHGVPHRVALSAASAKSSTARRCASLRKRRHEGRVCRRARRAGGARRAGHPAHWRPGLFGARAVFRALPGPVLQLRRRRAEHGRRRHGPGRGRLRARSPTPSRPSPRCAPTSSFATAPCSTACPCASSAWAGASTTATTA